MKNTTPVAMTVSRIHGLNEKEIRIAIEDRVSGCQVCEVKMSLSEFAEMVTGLGSCKGEAKWSTDYLLKKREVKTEFVKCIPNDGRYYLGSGKEYAEYRKQCLAPHEVDGWLAREDDFGNSHRATYGKDENGKHTTLGYNVIFIRFVEATQDDIEAARKKGA